MKNSSSHHCLNRFLGKEDGNIAIAFALAAIPAFIIIGAAIDMSRGYQSQTRLQTVLDAATLAAAAEYQSSKSASAAEAKLQSYVDAGLAEFGMARASSAGTNGTANGGGTTGGTANSNTSTSSGSTSQVILSNTTFNTSTNSITPTMTVNVGTTLLGLAGINSIATTVTSSATVGELAAQSVEVSIMVDLTGSMGWTATGDISTKVANLRLAGKDMIDILMPAGSDAKAKVAIAPFADYVNAGTYASAATGQSSTGSYTNIVDLAKTKNGPFQGNYTGYYGTSANLQPIGSQSGATTAGVTYTNTHCAVPSYSQVQIWTGEIGNSGKWRTGPIGKEANRFTPGAVDIDDDIYDGYWKQDGSNNGKYEWMKDEGNKYYVPLTTTVVTTGCETTAQPQGQLITCVTERTDANHRYDDESPSAGGNVGAYNATASSSANKVNYSSDGKCNVAGRELPKVMPLTNDRTGPYAFFDGLGSSSVGGATPGHIGTAWAWYMLSPKWKTVFTSNPAAEYGSARKVAVLMTDGEYNVHYASPTAREQALALCANMKAAGIEVYTVGFGFGQGTTANASGNSSERAMDLLTQCSSGDNHYYFPYNGAKLREAFQAIGNSIVAGTGTKNTATRMTQ